MASSRLASVVPFASGAVSEAVWAAGATAAALAPGAALEAGSGAEAALTVVLEGELVRAAAQGTAAAQGGSEVVRAGEATGLANLIDPAAAAADEPSWRAGDKGAVVWRITAGAFGRLRAADPRVEAAFTRYIAMQIRASLGPVLAPAARADAAGTGPRPIVRIFDSQQYQYTFFEELNADPKYRYRLEPLDVRLNESTVNLAAGAFAVCVFVSDQITAKVARALKDSGVHMIALRCAGFDFVDLKACNELGLSVARVPAYSPYAVAEHAVAMLMCLNRKLHIAYNKVRVGDFSLNGLVGFDLHGKTVGVIGTGKIGACLIDILVGFGCRILCYDMYKSDAVAAKPNTSYTDLATLLRESDAISLHAPLTDETKHLINDATLATTKRGMILINTSRGALVDTKALVRVLKSGHLGGCALDVYEGERDYFYRNLQGQVITDDLLARLMTFENVIITSHQGFLTNEALSAIAATTLANIYEYEHGKRMKELSNTVN